MAVKCGKVNDDLGGLGMTMDFSKSGKFIIDMKKYREQVWWGQGHWSDSSSWHLLKTRASAEKLNEADAELFHSPTAKLLWVSNRSRPGIKCATFFLCARVKEPENDDYKKLARIVKYLHRTKFRRLILEATHLDQNYWLIDEAFAVHDDMQSHMGLFMTFGRGMMNGSSTKQRYTQPTLQSLRWWQFMTTWGPSCGPDTSLRHRDTTWNPAWFTKTIRVQCCWRRMDKAPAANE